MKNIAIILAAGNGKRFSSKLCKQLHRFHGKTMLEFSIQKFQNAKDIDEILLVLPRKMLSNIHLHMDLNKYSKIKHTVAGGSSRFDSCYNAIQACDSNSNLLFHDANRPLVSPLLINDVIQALKTHKAVTPAVPVTESIIHTCHGYVLEVPEREELYHIQTPQGFQYAVISEAFELAKNSDKQNFTECCGVLKYFCPKVDILQIAGEPNNIKLTYQHDAPIIESFLNNEINKAA